MGLGFYIIYIAKTASKIIRALICSMKFLSSEVVLYLQIYYTIYMEYCCHVWPGAPNSYLAMLYNYKNRYAHSWSFSFSISITLIEVYLNWLNWLHFLILEGGKLIILIDCMIFLSTFLDAIRISMSIVSFLVQLGFGFL